MAEKKSRWGRKEKKEPAPAPVLATRQRNIDLPDRDVQATLIENYFTIEECEKYMKALLTEVDWKKQQVDIVKGKGKGDEDEGKGKGTVTVEEPRRTTFMSDPGICYEYSGRDNVGVGWHPVVLEIKKKAEAAFEKVGLPPVKFNSAQMNRYDGPRHTLGMHADNEPDLDRDQPIVSVSFGATREFHIQDKKDESQKWIVELADGAWFIMAGAFQQHYLHGVPACASAGPRVNITFRVCIPRPPHNPPGGAVGGAKGGFKGAKGHGGYA
eukprot:TRINITY_DN4986_c1_g2_i3.p1 TRINITY_DN4986_c1_g2~~TRINITY_DN4986_c1_g2_i3.p1  ORF type:complete len:269 (-),score=59.15 TRINITY_DN4986_c1_g2_i3:604-1410(-)